MDNGWALFLQERLDCLANRQEVQTNIQSLSDLNFEGKEPSSTRLFIVARKKWSKTSCHQSHNCWRGVSTEGLRRLSIFFWDIFEDTSNIFLVCVGRGKTSEVTSNSILSLVVWAFLSSLNSISYIVGLEGLPKSTPTSLPTSTWSSCIYLT